MQLRVLIADSDAELHDLFRDYLSGQNFCVQTATDGLDFMAKLRQSPPDVAVVDMNILWGGGEGVMATLREEDAIGLPVILTSTSIIDDAEPPVVGCLRKPFALSRLAAALAELHCKLSRGLECAS